MSLVQDKAEDGAGTMRKICIRILVAQDSRAGIRDFQVKWHTCGTFGQGQGYSMCTLWRVFLWQKQMVDSLWTGSLHRCFVGSGLWTDTDLCCVGSTPEVASS